MARVYKQRNKWCFAIECGHDEFGKRKRIVRGGFATQREAKRKSIEMETQILSGRSPQRPDSITLHDFMFDVWYEYQKDFVKTSSRYAIKTVLKRIDNYFKPNLKLQSLRPAMCTAFVHHLLDEQELQRNTVSVTLMYFKMMLKHAVIVEKLLVNSPAEFVFMPKKHLEERESEALYQENKPLYLEKEQLKKFMAAAWQAKTAFPFAYICKLLIYTGMRAGEALALEWKNVDFENNVIRVRSTSFFMGGKYVINSPKTRSSVRDIPVSPNLMAELKQYRKLFLEFKMSHRLFWQDSPYDFVFSSALKPGKPISTASLGGWVKRIGLKSGIAHLHPHIFRHTHVSLLAAQKVPLSAIKERLGHADDKITEGIYLHITRSLKLEVVDKFEQAVEGL